MTPAKRSPAEGKTAAVPLCLVLHFFSEDTLAGSALHGHGNVGGSVRVTGGSARGHMFPEAGCGRGGNIQLVSGAANKGFSGSVLVQTGLSEQATCGAIGEGICSTGALHQHQAMCSPSTTFHSDGYLGCQQKGRHGIPLVEHFCVICRELGQHQDLERGRLPGPQPTVGQARRGTGNHSDGGNVKVLAGSMMATASIQGQVEFLASSHQERATLRQEWLVVSVSRAYLFKQYPVAMLPCSII